MEEDKGSIITLHAFSKHLQEHCSDFYTLPRAFGCMTGRLLPLLWLLPISPRLHPKCSVRALFVLLRGNNIVAGAFRASVDPGSTALSAICQSALSDGFCASYLVLELKRELLRLSLRYLVSFTCIHASVRTIVMWRKQAHGHFLQTFNRAGDGS